MILLRTSLAVLTIFNDTSKDNSKDDALENEDTTIDDALEEDFGQVCGWSYCAGTWLS